jgi:hypothetical protein
MRAAITLLGLALAGSALSAQEQQLQRPGDWKVRFDRPGQPDTAVYFVAMPPGWHITTGPAGILYNPATVARGEFRIKATVFLFDPGQRHREAYGVLFGGRDLDGVGQSYTYFLIRDSGEFLVKRRDGDSTSTVRNWTTSDAVVRHPGGEGNVKNELIVEARADVVDFFVNGRKVVTVPRSELQVDGIVGLRVNHHLNLHVSELTVEPLGTTGDD